MATTVTPAPLTYTLTESCELAGSQRGSSFKKTVNNSVVEYSRVVRSIGQSAFMTVMEFAESPLNSGSQFDLDEVKYIRITNLDDTDGVAIALVPTTGNAVSLLISPGMTFMFGTPKISYADSETNPFRSLSKIRLRGQGSGDVDVEVVVGSL